MCHPADWPSAAWTVHLNNAQPSPCSSTVGERPRAHLGDHKNAGCTAPWIRPPPAIAAATTTRACHLPTSPTRSPTRSVSIQDGTGVGSVFQHCSVAAPAPT
jgi:hypothetical protein